MAASLLMPCIGCRANQHHTALCCSSCASLLLQLWRQHWDFQLYKALDVQYRVGLESINKTLPEVSLPDVSVLGAPYSGDG